MTTEERLEAYRRAVEEALRERCASHGEAPYETLLKAMRYSLLAGGKRLRPTLTLEFCRVSGGDVEAAMPVALAVELLHTYSLIHDDLPCMDNDDLRRGKPTNHRVFGEYTAVLAGDALQAEAFASILSASLPPERTVKCASALALAAGHHGICGGQQLDLDGEGKPLSEEELLEIHRRKTSALLEAACVMGVAAAGGTPEQENAAAQYAEKLGLAFQIRDDMLDVIADEAEFGKPIGSDAESGKTTFVTLLGLPACQKLVLQYTEEAKAALGTCFSDASFLKALADRLSERRT